MPVRGLGKMRCVMLLFALAVDLVIWLSEGANGLPIESIAIALILSLGIDGNQGYTGGRNGITDLRTRRYSDDLRGNHQFRPPCA